LSLFIQDSGAWFPQDLGALFCLYKSAYFLKRLQSFFRGKTGAKLSQASALKGSQTGFSHEFNILFLLIFYKSGDWHLFLLSCTTETLGSAGPGSEDPSGSRNDRSIMVVGPEFAQGEMITVFRIPADML
jgi:hypothetical protein